MLSFSVHHIGYLVKKIEKAKQTFLSLGYHIEQETVIDDLRKVKICFLIKDGYRIELISPVSADSVVSGLMKKYKNSPYHICYETAGLEASIAALTADGFIVIDTPTPAPALGGRRVVFLTSASAGMIELLETETSA
ncbi:MAG: VOC family protein [Lachnospiraceae bacterium]